MKPVSGLVVGVMMLLLCRCAAGGPEAPMGSQSAGTRDEAGDGIAESYVRLVLAMGQHDPDFVDAYYGPPEWREEAEAEGPTLAAIRERAAALRASLNDLPADPADPMLRLRHRFLARQLEALIARADMLQGKRLSFDEESLALYDAVSPRHDERDFQAILDRLELLLPGSGPLLRRYEDYRAAFAIPADRVDAVFQAAIGECRRRTARFIDLPGQESFVLEYVTGKPWGGYNWYQGNFHSLIQINLDQTVFIDRALDLACHEGYPGHHVFNMMLEEHLVRDRGWREFSVYPLFSPQSLIAEGTASFGVDIAFPGGERVRYEREVLFPLAGLDADGAAAYYEIQALVEDLTTAGNEAARRYLDGEMDAGQTAGWLAQYALMSDSRARQRVRFIDKYRSYVINYNVGKDLVRRFIETRAGTDGPTPDRWEAFIELLSTPRLPSDLN